MVPVMYYTVSFDEGMDVSTTASVIVISVTFVEILNFMKMCVLENTSHRNPPPGL